MNDLITVAMAVYNAESYVAKAINSIIYQNYKNLEIINKLDNKKTLKEFKDKVKSLEDCRVYALPSKSDRFRLAYEFSKIENSKKKRR